MYWDRFDICEAWWLYACHYHGGQWSKLYSILSHKLPVTMQFNPSPWLDENHLTENGREIYQSLVDRKVYQDA